MSWGVLAVGKPAAVATNLAIDFAKNKCVEPEETIRQHVAAALAAGLAVAPPNIAVRVEASGSQGTVDGGIRNTLSVKMEAVYGFVE